MDPGNRKFLRHTSFFLLISLIASYAALAEPPILRAERTITPAGMRVLEYVEPDLQRYVDQMERLPGQDRLISVKINPEPATGFIWIDLSLGFMPRGQTDFDEGLGEKVREVNEELARYVEGNITYLSIRARIGGKTLNDWFPPVPARSEN